MGPSTVPGSPWPSTHPFPFPHSDGSEPAPRLPVTWPSELVCSSFSRFVFTFHFQIIHGMHDTLSL